MGERTAPAYCPTCDDTDVRLFACAPAAARAPIAGKLLWAPACAIHGRLWHIPGMGGSKTTAMAIAREHECYVGQWGAPRYCPDPWHTDNGTGRPPTEGEGV